MRMQTEFAWWTKCLFSLGALEAGTYDVRFIWTFSHPLPDGGDYDGGYVGLYQLGCHNFSFALSQPFHAVYQP